MDKYTADQRLFYFSNLNSSSISLQDACLSGFTDAALPRGGGCFTVFTSKTTGLKFILDQNNKQILENIAALFSGGTVTLRSFGLNTIRYRYQVSHLTLLIPIFILSVSP